MKNLKWKYNKEECGWELQVKEGIKIELDKCYGVYSVWMNEVKIGDCYDCIADAKEKGLKVARAILDY